MEKRCLIIMPKTDPEGYAQGHFNRVYQYIVVPACRFAGFSPSRADDPIASDTAMDILKNLVEYEMVICDLSSKYPLALYAFAIRQSLNLPVTLIHDAKTRIAIELQAYGAVEYDDSLRIDTVQTEIESLSGLLTHTFANKAERNTLLNRLDLGGGAQESSSASNDQEEHARQPESHIPVISPIPDYVGDTISQQEELDALKVGDVVFHINYGKGEIKTVGKMAKDKVARIEFETESKLLVLTPSGKLRRVKQ